MTEYFQCPNIRVDADELLKPSTATPNFIQNDLKTAAPANERDTVNLLDQLRDTGLEKRANLDRLERATWDV